MHVHECVYMWVYACVRVCTVNYCKTIQYIQDFHVIGQKRKLSPIFLKVP